MYLQTGKFLYHLFCTIFLLYLALFYFYNSKYIQYILIIIALFHLYDCWWFYYEKNKNAPI